jgi:hypothetical protein
MRDRRTPIPQLIDTHHRRVQQPRTLHPRNLLPRRTNRAHLHTLSRTLHDTTTKHTRASSHDAPPARGTSDQTSWRGPRKTAKKRLDQRNYRDKRERERERDVSALLTHLPTGTLERTPTLITPVPNGLTRKQPLFIRPGPSPQQSPTSAQTGPEEPTQTRSITCPEHQSTLTPQS